ncbi:MAG: N-acetylmuramoyl-L-alanine amidase [Verrucomicrobiae bacterium]|nr:N-acetylmuramoyl-L-alanine amidase [Verrucomicrobiae bacterium]
MSDRLISRQEFDWLLDNIYCPSGAIRDYLRYEAGGVWLTPQSFLRFGSSADAALRTRKHPILRTIALDPGHIGGAWAQMEERWFQLGNDPPVAEAALNLTVARLLQPRLEALGFRVVLTKTNFEPVTPLRPEDFLAQADEETPPDSDLARRAQSVRRRAEWLFYRRAEIAARAQLLNEKLRPDLTLAIHFNAIPWTDSRQLAKEDHLLFFVHGNYLPEEVAEPAQRQRLFFKLLNRTHEIEIPVADSIARAFQRATGFPPAQFPVPVGYTGHVFARNLAANRLYDSPTVYLEPYYMNSCLTYQRIQRGDYDGEQVIEGRRYRSIFREYADAVAEGLAPFIPR